MKKELLSEKVATVIEERPELKQLMGGKGSIQGF
jgi:hypothetical protein